MSAGDSLSARVDQLLLDLGRGVDIDVLVEVYGHDDWNAAVLLAAAGKQVDTGEADIPQDILIQALASEHTTPFTRAQGLVHRACRISLDGGFAAKFAFAAVVQLKQLGVELGNGQGELAWLELGKRHSRQAKDPNYQGLGWAQVDAADHILAALEPHVGPAPELRKWACSADCALPNTLLAYRRGQLKINAAKARVDLGLVPKSPPAIQEDPANS